MKNLSDTTYKNAWHTLAMCLGEQNRQEDLELMNSILEDMRETQSWLDSEQEDSSVIAS